MDGQSRGLIVDAVSDIVTVSDDDIQPPPTNANDAVIPYLEGLIALEDKMVMVLELSKLISDVELANAA